MVTVKEQIANFPNYSQLIATTYNLDFRIIKELICPNKSAHERSIIISDKDEFSKENISQDFFNQGISHFVFPAQNVTGAFHPKVILGIDEGLIRLLIGSHNLTEYGTKYNLEITAFHEIPLTINNKYIIDEIITFINGLATTIPDITIKKTLSQMAKQLNNITITQTESSNEKKYYFLSSYKKPILDQVIEILPQIIETSICVPTHSQDPNFVIEMAKKIGKLKFLVSPRNTSISAHAKKAYEKFEIQGIDIKENRDLHAKFYVFHTTQGDWVLYGSPNFTAAALTKSLSDRGNVEAAILMAPSKKWKWQNLFKNPVELNKITWEDLPSTDGTDNQKKEPSIVENWGYQTPNNEAVILAPGLTTGDKYYIRLFGKSNLIEVIVSNGALRFKLPLDWVGESRFEVLDKDNKVVGKGFLNRSGETIHELFDLQLDDESKVLLWFYLNRLRYSDIRRFGKDANDLPLVHLDPNSWLDGKGRSIWSPVMSNLSKLTPQSIFWLAKNRFEKARDYYFASDEADSKKLRSLITSIDLYSEGTFYSSVLSSSNDYIVQYVKDLSDLFAIPCNDNPTAIWDETLWKKDFNSELNDKTLEEWAKIGNKVRLDVSFIFNFWLYFNSDHIKGFQTFSNRSLDGIININRLYQLYQTQKMLLSNKKQDASFNKVWDDRINFLAVSRKNQPENYQQMEDSIERCGAILSKRFMVNKQTNYFHGADN